MIEGVSPPIDDKQHAWAQQAEQKVKQLEGMHKDWSAKTEQKTKQFESMQRKLLILGAITTILSITALIISAWR